MKGKSSDVRNVLNQWYNLIQNSLNEDIVYEINPEFLRTLGFRDIYTNKDGNLNASYGDKRYFNLKYVPEEQKEDDIFSFTVTFNEE